MKTGATYCKRRELMVAPGEMLNNEWESTHKTNESTLKELQDFCNRMVHKLDKTRNTLADQQLKLKAMRTANKQGERSTEYWDESLQGVERYWRRVKFLPWGEFEWQRHPKGNK